MCDLHFILFEANYVSLYVERCYVKSFSTFESLEFESVKRLLGLGPSIDSRLLFSRCAFCDHCGQKSY